MPWVPTVYIPGTVQDIGDTAVNKEVRRFCLYAIYILVVCHKYKWISKMHSIRDGDKYYG